jgi:hypothetical protein
MLRIRDSYYLYKIPPNCVVIHLFGATVFSNILK